MADAVWKQVERRVAKALGGNRLGPTGRQGPDVDAGWLVVECKHRARLPLWLTGALQQAKRAARDDQLPLVVLHERGRHDSLVVMSLSDFRDWFDGEGATENDGK